MTERATTSDRATVPAPSALPHTSPSRLRKTKGKPELRSLEEIRLITDPKVGEGPGQVASRMLTEMSADEFKKHSVDLLVDWCRSTARGYVRRIEDEAFGPDYPPPKPSDLGEKRHDMMSQRFWLPNGESPTWGEATADQHEMRADYQEGSAQSLMADAERHRAAAADIRSHGVTCLAEIEVAA